MAPHDFPSHHSINIEIIRESVISFFFNLRDGSMRSVGRRETRVGRIDLDDGMPISEDGIAKARAMVNIIVAQKQRRFGFSFLSFRRCSLLPFF